MKKIVLTAAGVEIPAILNDTKAARDFERRLPFRVTCRDSGLDYCGPAARGRIDPCELGIGWKNGDILLYSGWFALLYAGEETSRAYGDTMIIGRFDDLDTLRNLPDTIHLTVSEALSSPPYSNKKQGD